MKIHIWAPAFTGFGGGIGTFSRELGHALQDLGHDLHLFGKLDQPGLFNGSPLHGTGRHELLRTPRFAALCLSACMRRKPDLVVSTHLNFAPVAHLSRRVTGTPVAIVAHGIDAHADLPRLALSGLRAADRIVAVSSWTRERVLSLGGVDANRVFVLPNTFDEARFLAGPARKELIERYRIAPDEKVVMTVARLDARERYKGYDRLVEAMPAVIAACGKVRLIIVGDGDDANRVRKTAHDLGFSDAVTLAGFVPDEELADHYRIANVFAMPSTGEGFGIVYLEAMACGTPVLAGNLDGAVDALDTGALGMLVNPLDVNEIASGLISILKGEGPALWFDRQSLRKAAVARFGAVAFRGKVKDMLLPFVARV